MPWPTPIPERVTEEVIDGVAPEVASERINQGAAAEGASALGGGGTSELFEVGMGDPFRDPVPDHVIRSGISLRIRMPSGDVSEADGVSGVGSTHVGSTHVGSVGGASTVVVTLRASENATVGALLACIAQKLGETRIPTQIPS